jgi:hypothetical protein
MFGRREQRKREIWDEIISYSRRAAEYPSAEAFEPVRQAQLDAARRLYGAHRRDTEQLLERAARSNDPFDVSLGLWLAVRLGVPRAGQLLDGALQRFRRGEQKLRPHPALTAPEGIYTEAGLLDVLEDLKDEIR